MSLDSVEIDRSKNVNDHRSYEVWVAAEKEWIRVESNKLRYHVSEEEESEKQRLSAGDPASDDEKSKIINSNNGLVSAGYTIELP